MSTKSHSESSSMGSKVKKNQLSKMSDDGDDEVDDKGVIKRKSRNLSEKKRRDQFNVLINELCSMVCTGKRKMDKSTVLKSAISFIRNHNQVAMQSQSQEVQEDWKPSFLSNEEFTHLMLEALDGFIMVFASTGKILYVSENITCLLGHVPNDLIGTMIYDLVWEEEQGDVQSFLGSWASSDSESHDSRGKENHLSLTCHLRRGNTCDGDLEANYELVCFSGYYRIQGNPDVSSASRISSSWGDDSKGSSSFGDALSQYNGLVFVASARLQTPQLIVEMSLVDVSKSEFTSRHSLEWKFLFLDHRGPPIIGYLPFEVLGTSGYDYYHIDDLEKVSACHEALMQKGEGTSCCYRFLTKGQQWIWLQTKYYITYHQWNSKPEFIVCSHRVVSHNEVLGHPAKETPPAKSESRHSCVGEAAATASVPSSGGPSFSSNKNKPEQRISVTSGSSGNNNNVNANVNKSSVSSPNAPNPAPPALSNSNRGHSSSNMITNSSNRERSKHSNSKYSSHHHRLQQHHPHHQQHSHPHQQQHHQQSHQAPSSGASDAAGESGMLLPPPAPPGGNDAMAQHSRHPSGSSRGMGATLSDTGSISSSGSFQSAASQHSGHSRQSDQSMQSLHSQQSHHSMQSVHSQHSSQHSQSMRPTSSSHNTGTPQHQTKQPLIITSSHQQGQQVHYTSSNSGQYRNVHTNSPRSGDETSTYLSSSAQSSISNAGHRFLQPRSSSTASVRRNSSNSHPVVVSTATSTAVSTATGTFTYQSVVPIGVADGSHTQGVTLPVQRIIEGLPVVTLPAGLVTHEPIVMTAAQRQLHEQLRVKHAQLQRQIMAQQEELRRVSEQLLLAQYGAWGSTVLKMTVPFSEGEGSSTTTAQPTHHAVLSAGGLVTCLTTESPVGLAQATSPQLGSASGGQAVTFSPGTPILVHSPELHAHSPPGNTESLSVATDPSQVVFRTALQQDTLVQLSQQDVQMLLAQSLLQDNPSLSIEYLP